MAEVALDFSQAQPIGGQSTVSLDFTRPEPITQSRPVSLDFSKRQPLTNSPVTLNFRKTEPLPAPAPSAWDHIREMVGRAIPESATGPLAQANRYFVQPFERIAQAGAEAGRETGRDVVTGATLLQHGGDYLNASLPSPYGPKPSVISSERLAEQQHPIALGVAGGVGSVVGSTVADPRNWPFFGSSTARPLLQKLIARGFAAQMGAQTYQSAKTLYDQWDKLTPTERAEIGTKTGVGALFLAKGLTESVGKKTSASETPTHTTHPIDLDSPVGQVLHDPTSVPSVRVADSAAAARDLIEKDTQIRPAQETGDRRLDVARRARVAEMSPEEMKRELLTSKVTGLPNRRAFDEANTSPAVGMSDVDGLKALNDKFGYAAGDALLKAKAEALRQAGVDAYHDKGDEFLARGESREELESKLEQARSILRERQFAIKMDDGKVLKIKGADFSHGQGANIAEAETGLKQHKAEREARGERARGELRGITTTRAETSSVDQAVAPEKDAQARVSGPRDIAEFRNPTARVVSGGHVPVVSREEILAHAVSNVLNNSDELQRAGVDLSSIQSTRDVDAVLQRASDVIKSNLDPRAETSITFEAQKQLAADLNMSVEDLLSRRGGEAFNTEHALAARALLAQSAKHVVTLAKNAAQSGDTESLNAATTALAQHQAVAENVAGITAEAGRALGGFRIDKASLPEIKIANVLSKLSPEARAEAVRLLSKFDPGDPSTVRKVNQFAEKVKPSTTLDKLFEYYRNALLSSPHTIIVKTASEASMVAMEAMKKALAGGIAKFKSSPDRFASEAYYYAKGMTQALSEHAKPILSGEFQLEGSPGFERAGQQAIKGKLGSVIRVPSEAMSRMTNLIYAGNYFGELNSLAARQALSEHLEGDAFHARQEYLAHHASEEMSEAAHKLAMTNTFQSELGTFAEKIGQAIAAKPNAAWLPESLKSVSPLKFLFPFYKTPINLVKATLTHATPFELLNGIAKGDTDAMARGVLGSSISAAIAYLALNGTITGGGPTDYKKEETKRATGWQPYSVKISNKYISYRRFEPLGLAMGLIADAVHAMKSGDSEVVAQSKADSAVKHIMRNLDDLPFMGTLANLLQTIHDPVGGRAQSFINREAGSLIPAGVANVAETLDPTIRRPQTALQAIESRIPGLTKNVPAVIGIGGLPAQRPSSNLGGGNPFPVSTSKGDPVLDALAQLGIGTPQPPEKLKWRGKEVELTPRERERFAREEGAAFYERVSKLITSPGWGSQNDDQRRKLLIEIHRLISNSRPQRLTKVRRESQPQ